MALAIDMFEQFGPAFKRLPAKVALSFETISRKSNNQTGTDPPWKQMRDTGAVPRGSARIECDRIKAKELTEQALFASLPRTFFAASRALRFSRFDNGSPFAGFAAPPPSSSGTTSPSLSAWFGFSSENSRSPSGC
jgi:hypothetical protein